MYSPTEESPATDRIIIMSYQVTHIYKT